MLFHIGDIVTRESYKNDTFFRIIDIVGETAYLKGINLRLYADSELSDLNKVENKKIEDDDAILSRVDKEIQLDRSEYFYLPGKVLHVDGDEEYLKRCMNLYRKLNIMAYGLCLNENDISTEITSYLERLNPNILVITGHDAYYKRKGSITDIKNYKNTEKFIEAVKMARSYEKSQDNLIIVAGACQSNYEELIKAGATFASSPKRINIHALDPAIIASGLALYDRNKIVDLIHLLEKTKYGADGIGGVTTKGCMYVGYPR
ncbi:MAG: sporulation peptidase YabG [Firmicutes bacterium]|nr:sporulation peptidase YabG [Bacillota bacterium]